MEDMRYLLEAEVINQESKVKGRYRLYLSAPNDTVAKCIKEVTISSLEKCLAPYYGNGCVKVKNFVTLMDVE